MSLAALVRGKLRVEERMQRVECVQTTQATSATSAGLKPRRYLPAAGRPAQQDGGQAFKPKAKRGRDAHATCHLNLLFRARGTGCVGAVGVDHDRTEEDEEGGVEETGGGADG